MPEEDFDTGSLDELPQKVCEGIVRDIGNFAVAIFGISRIGNDETLTFCGSSNRLRTVDFTSVIKMTNDSAKNTRPPRRTKIFSDDVRVSVISGLSTSVETFK